MTRTDIMLAKYIKMRLTRLFELGCCDTEESYLAVRDIIKFLDCIIDGENK